jgi:predicted metal-binding membrane protein
MHVIGGRGEWSLGERAKTVQEMGWPRRREGWCLGCGWDMVIVVYVGESVHVRAFQLQAPTRRPKT